MFTASFFDNPIILLQGAFVGFIFGFLLQKGNVANFDTIIGQFILKDFTVLKIIFSAILVGSFGLYSMEYFDLIDPIIATHNTIGNVLIGGLIFGIGISLLGYCPGTCVAAAGQGAKDAIWGILGMILGTAIFAELYEIIIQIIPTILDLGNLTLATLIGVNPFLIILGLIAFALLLFYFLVLLLLFFIIKNEAKIL